MMRFVRDFRLIPVVLLAAVCLLGLKILGIVLDGGFTLADLDFSSAPAPIAESEQAQSPSLKPDARPAEQPPKVSWAQEMFNYPDVTGSIDSKPDDKKPSAAAPPNVRTAQTRPAETKPGDKPQLNLPEDAKAGAGTVIQLNQNGVNSPAERAILERLGERRQELDARARELEIRENLLKSAEKRLDGRVNELKTLEQQAGGSAAKKDAEDAARLKGLVTMYENMKPKDAAKIFDRLEMPVLIAVVSQIKPRVMSDILAQMQPEAAERLTTELASRAVGLTPAAAPTELPKIEGQKK
jgi:flagellar motility protein MotE (MotC chaperone)